MTLYRATEQRLFLRGFEFISKLMSCDNLDLMELCVWYCSYNDVRIMSMTSVMMMMMTTTNKWDRNLYICPNCSDITVNRGVQCFEIDRGE